MSRIALLLAAVLVAIHAWTVTAAQLYRWVDNHGRVEWRDTPPPANANAKKIERRTISGSVIETSTLPYSVQQAIRNFPVTLYATNCGEGCTLARAHLARRGIHYTEKNPQDNPEAYKKLSGGMEVPLLLVGRDMIKGYLESSWDSALDTAGYPREPVPGYTAPRPATTSAKKPAPAAEAAAPQGVASRPAAAQ